MLIKENKKGKLIIIIKFINPFTLTLFSLLEKVLMLNMEKDTNNWNQCIENSILLNSSPSNVNRRKTYDKNTRGITCPYFQRMMTAQTVHHLLANHLQRLLGCLLGY